MRPGPKVDHAVVAEILRLHGTGVTNSEIARQTGRKRQYVDFHLRKNGKSPNRSPDFALQDTGCLDVIDTWGKAYTLGFTFADGAVESNRCLSFNLHRRDVSILEYIRSQTGSTAKIELPTRGKHVNHARLRFGSIALIAALGRHGVVARKSLTLRWPTTVPENLTWAFVLGYFDGDGSVGLYPTHREDPKPYLRPVVFALCSWDFAPPLREFLLTQGVATNIQSGCESGAIAKVVTNSRVHTTGWLRAMYHGAEFCLARKREKATEVIDWYNRPDSRAE